MPRKRPTRRAAAPGRASQLSLSRAPSRAARAASLPSPSRLSRLSPSRAHEGHRQNRFRNGARQRETERAPRAETRVRHRDQRVHERVRVCSVMCVGLGGALIGLYPCQASSPFTCHRSWCSSALCALTMSRSITQRRLLPGVHSSRAGRQNFPEARTRRARWRAASAATRKVA